MDRRSGKCKVRTNRNGKLYADTYGSLSATNFDPLEKKPLYHFHPGNEILSLGSLGCNFACACCQNYEISQSGIAGFPRLQKMDVGKVIKSAKDNIANIGIAYTYNEPFVWYEYMYDVASRAKSEGLLNVVVSNGYINPEPLEELIGYIDAFNIDLKAFDVRGYKEFTGGELPYVLHTLATIIKMGKHLEITLLVIPGFNDDLLQFESMLQWISERLGKDIPLHLSRYFPHYEMDTPATPVSHLVKMAEKASNFLHYVYIGNVPMAEYQDTYCPDCGTLVIRRKAYNTHLNALTNDGCCTECGYKIAVT
jgi:pyruvate formate lyase activating enzyme